MSEFCQCCSNARQRLSRYFANTSPPCLPWWPQIRNFRHSCKDFNARAGRVNLCWHWLFPSRPAWDRGSAWLSFSESPHPHLLLSLVLYFKNTDCLPILISGPASEEVQACFNTCENPLKLPCHSCLTLIFLFILSQYSTFLFVCQTF